MVAKLLSTLMASWGQIFTREFRQNAVTVYPVCDMAAEYILDDGTVLSAAQLDETGVERTLERKYLYSATCIELNKK